MSFSHNLNQFTQTPAKGQISSAINFNILSAKILSTSTNTLYPATAIKIVNTNEKEIVIDKAASNDDISGFVVLDKFTGTKVAGDIVNVAYIGSIMNMEAGASIQAGQRVEIVAIGDQVIPYAGTNTSVGRALVSASTGEIVKIMITTI